MKRIPILGRPLAVLLTVLLLVSTVESSIAQNTLKGKVEYKQVNQKIKIQRGSNYRKRGKDKERAKDAGETLETRAINSIVSLKPLTKKIAVVKRNGTLVQRDKSFAPHVLAITAGSNVSFTNEDEFFHNVFSLSKGNRFNIGRKKPNVAVKKTFKKPGLVKVFCDIHPQMSAFILCLDTPYFSDVDSEGNYEIVNIPDGDYTLQFFNPSVEISDQVIELRGGQITTKDFIITPDQSTSTIHQSTYQFMSPCCSGTMCSHTTAE